MEDTSTIDESTGDDPPDGSPPDDGTDDPPADDAPADDPPADDPPADDPPADDPPADGTDRREKLLAVAVAVGLGVLGPAIAVFSGLGVFLIDGAAGGLSMVGRLLLTLFFGQYVAFAGLAIAYLAWRGLDRSGIVEYLGVRRPTVTEMGLVIGGWALMFGLLMVISLVVQLIGAEPASNQSAEAAMASPEIIPLFILASFLVIGPCEEILYRGVVQGRLRESMSAVPAIVIASAVFAAIHVIALTGGGGARLMTITILFVPSLVFGAVYEYTGNIVIPSLLHGLHNAVLFTLMYIVIAFSDDFEELAEAEGIVEAGAAVVGVAAVGVADIGADALATLPRLFGL